MSRLSGAALRVVFALAATFVPTGVFAQVVYADLNGDGIHDRVGPGVHPTEIVVHLSAGHHQRRLHADSPIIRLAVVDFNRDGQPDLVATTRKPGGLMVWINRGHGRFSRHHATRPARERLEAAGSGTSPSHPGQQPGDNGDDVASRPLLRTTADVVPHHFSYIRRVPDGRVAVARFEGRTQIPRGPPSDQLF